MTQGDAGKGLSRGMTVRVTSHDGPAVRSSGLAALLVAVGLVAGSAAACGVDTGGAGDGASGGGPTDDEGPRGDGSGSRGAAGSGSARRDGGAAGDLAAAADAGAAALPDAAAPAPPGPCPVPPNAATKHTDVAYAATHPRQKVDVYVPNGPGPFPLVMWIHGGAWAGGDKGSSYLFDQARRGYVVASLNYRLSGQARFPAQIHDVKAALRFLRANAGTYRIDPARVGVGGDSAGGHLAALLGTSAGVAALEGAELGNAAQSSAVQGVVDFYGPTDFLQMDAQTPGSCGDQDHDGAQSPESRLVGCTIQTCKDVVNRASPLTYVDAQDPPFLILHGVADCTVASKQSELLHAALGRVAVPSTLELVAGAGHGGGAFTDGRRKDLVNTFLDARVARCVRP